MLENMEKEMNFWDLCRACGHAIMRACRTVCGWLATLVRLTYRMWWIVLPVLILAIAFIVSLFFRPLTSSEGA